jgi:chromate transporter
MIYLELFLTFLQIGAFSFGGGYGMISLIREKVLMYGWLGEEELLNMIAVAESTPGPIAMNIATFIGSKQGGVAGALVATLGLAIPSFVIILLIATILKNLMRYGGVRAFLDGVRPCVVALIVATGLTMLAGNLFGLSTVFDSPSVDVRGVLIFLFLVAVALLSKLVFKKKPSAVVMIALSGVLGAVVYSI